LVQTFRISHFKLEHSTTNA